ncbi:uncharacterized protein LOC123202887 [Mangifera indica]|uniref:uncharacterized protein LOC123202887 n=1 Tax=Mangifera indica TaxID=29780 RepID=UPI001CFBFF4D|nr:uncharacterized protein LOC123202887 [Mangifera indica]
MANPSNVLPSSDITSPDAVFHIKIYYCHCPVSPCPLNTMPTDDHLELNQTFRFTQKQLIMDPEGPRFISEKLSTMGLQPEVIESGISQIMRIARESAKNDAPEEILTIRILLHYSPNTDSDSEILEESMEDFPRPIPASKEAIQNLEKASFLAISESMRDCTICSEKFCANDGLNQIVQMPCGHVYHEGCIIKWLEISNMCPLCRYRLPTSYKNSAT